MDQSPWILYSNGSMTDTEYNETIRNRHANNDNWDEGMRPVTEAHGWETLEPSDEPRGSSWSNDLNVPPELDDFEIPNFDFDLPNIHPRSVASSSVDDSF